MTAKFGKRLVKRERCDYLRPTVILCDSPEPAIAHKEYMFPFVAVVQCPQEKMLDSIGPTLGQVRATGVAQLTSLRFSLVSGGVLCAIGGALAAVTLPSLWRYDDRTDPNAVRERAVRAARAEAGGEAAP